MMQAYRFAAVLMATCLPMAGLTSPARADTVAAPIFEFGHNSGGYPGGAPIADAQGSLYGVLSAGGPGQEGQVYRLTPPGNGSKTWRFHSLYNFGGHYSSNPVGQLAMDKTGNLYGVTQSGGSNYGGTVFELLKPVNAATPWQYLVLHHFGSAGDGWHPVAGVTIGSDGTLYGTTPSGLVPPDGSPTFGTAYSLTPPGEGKTVWKETILHTFMNGTDSSFPSSTLLIGPNGDLFGTARGGGGGIAANYGEVFELSPPASGTAWTFRALHRFAPGTDGVYPIGGLIADNFGNLFGATYTGGTTNFGTVYELTPPSGRGREWTEQVLTTFSGYDNAPTATLAMDGSGKLYGTTSGNFQYLIEKGHVVKSHNELFCGGSIFSLAPPASPGGSWVETSLLVFGSPGLFKLGCFPTAGLSLSPSGTLYGVTQNNAEFSVGDMFAVTP